MGGCQEKDVLFNLKAKGDAMTISCSTVEESGSTGEDGTSSRAGGVVGGAGCPSQLVVHARTRWLAI